MAHNEWGMARYPLVPGHEIVGIVDAVGSHVTKFKVGQRAAIGCIVDTCDSCKFCSSDLEPHCKESTWTYAGVDKVGNLGHTHGGYSERIVVSERYVLALPDNLDMAAAAPLLCAGITVWTPLVNAKIGPGKSVGVLGVGGLGHMALQLARALGAHVVALTRTASKKDQLLALGAHDVLVTSDAEALKLAADSLDLVIDTVSAEHDVNSILALLKFEGIYNVVGGSPSPLSISPFLLLFKKLNITGTSTGGIQSTQELLDFCGKHNITAKIELIALDRINEAFDRLENGDVRYRFVLDIKSAFGN